MDSTEWIHKRRKRYLAQVLEHFEQHIEILLPAEAAGAIQDFKGLTRARLNALAVDACELMDLTDRAMEQNGYGQEIRDRLHPTGRP
jgi:hypothetical protein